MLWGLSLVHWLGPKLVSFMFEVNCERLVKIGIILVQEVVAEINVKHVGRYCFLVDL